MTFHRVFTHGRCLAEGEKGRERPYRAQLSGDWAGLLVQQLGWLIGGGGNRAIAAIGIEYRFFFVDCVDRELVARFAWVELLVGQVLDRMFMAQLYALVGCGALAHAVSPGPLLPRKLVGRPRKLSPGQCPMCGRMLDFRSGRTS